jgi:hypothetical protein
MHKNRDMKTSTLATVCTWMTAFLIVLLPMMILLQGQALFVSEDGMAEQTGELTLGTETALASASMMGSLGQLYRSARGLVAAPTMLMSTCLIIAMLSKLTLGSWDASVSLT